MERVELLSENAVGKTVTPEILTGEERYYPNIMNLLLPNEQPHHVALLTKNGNLKIQVGNGEQRFGLRSSALVASERLLRVCSSRGGTIALLYEMVDDISVLGDGERRTIEISIAGGDQAYYLTEAKNAKSVRLDLTRDFIKDMADHTDFLGNRHRSLLDDLERQLANDEISGSEFVLKKRELQTRLQDSESEEDTDSVQNDLDRI